MEIDNEYLIFLPRVYPGWDTMFAKGYYEYLETFFNFTFYGYLLVLPEILEDSFFECQFSKEATRIKRNVYFLDLVDLALTYLGWCFKVIPF